MNQPNIPSGSRWYVKHFSAYMTTANSDYAGHTYQPKFFSESVTIASRVLQSSYGPNRIILTQTQEYVLRMLGVKRVRPRLWSAFSLF